MRLKQCCVPDAPVALWLVQFDSRGVFNTALLRYQQLLALK